VIYVSDDYQADPKLAAQLLFRPTDVLVAEYGYYINAEGAGFLRNYFASLKLDLELASTGCDQIKACLVVKELEELCHDLQKRISLAKQGQAATGGWSTPSGQSSAAET
jgi:hypothetical protein